MAQRRERETPERGGRGTAGGRARRRVALGLMAALAVAAGAAGCGEETLPLVVRSTSPRAGATGVPITAEVKAAFIVELESRTVTDRTFTLKEEGGAQVNGVVNTAGNTAIFSPTVKLKAGTTYRATISRVVRSKDGRNLAADYTWTFST